MVLKQERKKRKKKKDKGGPQGCNVADSFRPTLSLLAARGGEIINSLEEYASPFLVLLKHCVFCICCMSKPFCFSFNSYEQLRTRGCPEHFGPSMSRSLYVLSIRWFHLKLNKRETSAFRFKAIPCQSLYCIWSGKTSLASQWNKNGGVGSRPIDHR